MAPTFRALASPLALFTILPFLTYTAFLAAASVLPRHARESLFAVGASAVLVLFVGIHNAWDAVTYIALTRSRESEGPENPT